MKKILLCLILLSSILYVSIGQEIKKFNKSDYGISGWDLITLNDYDNHKFNEIVHNNQFIEDNQKNIWIRQDNGIVKYSEDNFQLYSNVSLSCDKVKKILFDSITNIWLLTDNSVINIENNKINTYNKTNILPSNKIENLAIDNNHNTWIFTNKGCILVSAEKKFITPKIANSKKTDFKVNHRGEVYFIAEDKKSFGVYDGTQNKTISLNNECIISLFDQYDNFWLLTNKDFISYSNNEVFTYKILEPLTEDVLNKVQFICSAKNEYWLSTKNETYHYVNDSWKIFNKENGFKGSISFMYKDINDDIWVGKNWLEYGLYKFSENTEPEKLNNGSMQNVVFEDRNNNLWFTDWGGLIFYDVNKKVIKDYSEELLTKLIALDNDTKDKLIGSKEENITGLRISVYQSTDEKIWFVCSAMKNTTADVMVASTTVSKFIGGIGTIDNGQINMILSGNDTKSIISMFEAENKSLWFDGINSLVKIDNY